MLGMVFLNRGDGREVAAPICQSRLRIINLFIWPLESSRNTATERLAKDGYNVLHWEAGNRVKAERRFAKLGRRAATTPCQPEMRLFSGSRHALIA